MLILFIDREGVTGELSHWNGCNPYFVHNLAFPAGGGGCSMDPRKNKAPKKHTKRPFFPARGRPWPHVTRQHNAAAVPAWAGASVRQRCFIDFWAAAGTPAAYGRHLGRWAALAGRALRPGDRTTAAVSRISDKPSFSF